jgi:hypothetical protein
MVPPFRSNGGSTTLSVTVLLPSGQAVIAADLSPAQAVGCAILYTQWIYDIDAMMAHVAMMRALHRTAPSTQRRKRAKAYRIVQ